MKEIISIRVDTLWKMMSLKKEGRLPGIDEEGATGVLDNKGAIFVPGGLIYQDVDEEKIVYDSYGKIGSEEFRANIRSAMKYDNATLLFPDGMVTGVNLDSGFFSKAARRIFTYKKAAMKRKKRFEKRLPFEISSEDVARSHCPTYMKEPYGARTRLSSCIAVGLIDPPMYYAHCNSELRLNSNQKKRLSENLNAAQEPITGKDGEMLSPPYLIVCHGTRYRETILTGITRILGFGKFGEFATFTLEAASRGLLHETKTKREEFSRSEMFAEYHGVIVVGVLRIYSATTPGKRSPRTTTRIVSPNDVGLDLERIMESARERYGVV